MLPSITTVTVACVCSGAAVLAASDGAMDTTTVDPARDGLEAGWLMLPVPASSASSCSSGVKTEVMKLMALSCLATY